MQTTQESIKYKVHTYCAVNLDKQSIEWFVCFVDAKGKFMYNLSAKNPRFTFPPFAKGAPSLISLRKWGPPSIYNDILFSKP